jgi:hypothetical protein
MEKISELCEKLCSLRFAVKHLICFFLKNNGQSLADSWFVFLPEGYSNQVADPNCLKNLRSFSKNILRSLI